MRIKVTFFTLQMISPLVAIHVYRYQSLCENSAEGMMVGKKKLSHFPRLPRTLPFSCSESGMP